MCLKTLAVILKRALTETFLCLNSFTCFNALSETLLPSHVELKPFECFIWSYSNNLEILLLGVRSGWNRIWIALVHLRKWKAKWIFHILDSSSSILVFGTLRKWSSFSKTKSCVFFCIFGSSDSGLSNSIVVFYSATNLNLQNSMVMLAFSVLGRKYYFWANLVQKIKIVTLNWNLALKLIWICRIQCWCLVLLFQVKNTIFGGQICSRKSKLSL